MYPWHYETTVSRFLLICQERVKKSDSDSEVHGIKKFLKSDEGNSLSSREPSVITEGTDFIHKRIKKRHQEHMCEYGFASCRKNLRTTTVVTQSRQQ